MQGRQKVIDLLKKQLTLELSSMDQYLTHGKMFEDWGVEELHAHAMHEYEEELDHVKKITERILFLEGVPDTTSRSPINIGSNVKEIIEFDLEAEKEVAESLRHIIGVCEQEKDYVTRDMLEELLNDTEMDHIYWLQQQLSLIDKIGLPNYIQAKMGK